MREVKVGLIGTGWVSQVHFNAFKQVNGAKVVAVTSRTKEKAKGFARMNDIVNHFDDYRDMLNMEEIDVVTVAFPNHMHAEVTVDAARAGKHVICEKPLCNTLEEADLMVEACKEHGVKLFYAEELCFIPKFIRAKELVDNGSFGKIYMVKQSEKHGGPYSEWFWDPERAGGGILMDMGCHSIEFCRWVLDKAQVKSVYAQMDTYLHTAITEEEDNVILILEFEGGMVGLLESSWALKGGMESKTEIIGTDGIIRADLCEGWGLKAYSEKGFGSIPSVTGSETRGWVSPDYEWSFNNGYPQEMRHFIDCILNDEEPGESGEDGRVVMEVMYAAYHSAGTGRKVELPFRPEGVKYPLDLWLNPRKDLLSKND